jgi:hypothetical protein
MLIKRKKFKKNQLIIKYFFLKFEIQKLILKSLLKNHYNYYLFRLSFTINNFFNFKFFFFKSLQKLVCPYSLCKRVPNKKFYYSRFFLNLQFNTLNINNTYV